MFIPQADYIRLLESFDAYMNEKVKYYKNEYESNLKREYPVALLGDIELHFNHYKSFEEAEQKWYERKQRMNEERLFVEMQTIVKNWQNDLISCRLNKKWYSFRLKQSLHQQ